MIDPNEALGLVRMSVDSLAIRDTDVDEVITLVLRFQALDRHLTAGGQLPMAWAQAPRPLTSINDGRERPLVIPADEPEPLGGPVPGANGHHLPDEELDDDFPLWRPTDG